MKEAKALLIFIVAACFFILAFLSIGAIRSIPPNPHEFITASATVQPSPTYIPLNGSIDFATADLETLDTLPGIGPATAQAVHDYIEQGGAFHFPEDIINVRGIGSKKLQDILPYLLFTYPPLPALTPLFPQ